MAAVAVVGVALVGCSGDDGALDLPDDDGTAAPSETDPPVEVTEDPDPPPDDDHEELYPPLPPLEPDPDSDIPVDEQQVFLDLHVHVYRATYNALTSNDYDRVELEDLLHGAALDAVHDRVEENRASGAVLRFPDSSVAWVRVVAVEGSRGVVQECQLNGPASGLYDLASEDRLGERDEAVARILETTYALVEIAPDSFEYRAIEVVAGEDAERCDVA